MRLREIEEVLAERRVLQEEAAAAETREKARLQALLEVERQEYYKTRLEVGSHILRRFKLHETLEAIRDDEWREGVICENADYYPLRTSLQLVSDPYPLIQVLGKNNGVTVHCGQEKTIIRIDVSGLEGVPHISLSNQFIYNTARASETDFLAAVKGEGFYEWLSSRVNMPNFRVSSVVHWVDPKADEAQEKIWEKLMLHIDQRRANASNPAQIRAWGQYLENILPPFPAQPQGEKFLTPKTVREWGFKVCRTPLPIKVWLSLVDPL